VNSIGIELVERAFGDSLASEERRKEEKRR